MNRIKIATSYDDSWLEIDRPQPLIDNKIEDITRSISAGDDFTDQVYVDFKKEMTNWIFSSQLNRLAGFDSFNRADIINGCTQFIDNLYMQGPVQVLRHDYRYHERLGLAYIKDIGSLIPGIPLIIAMPFPSIGDTHPDMEEILNEAKNKGINVHVDGAWLTCCRGINFDLSHPSIKSVAVSLSKGLGLGWNRIGLRWIRNVSHSDSISIMNDFHMNNRASSIIGLHFIRNLKPDYLWETHGTKNVKICGDFNLTPTPCIHLALKDNQPVGLSPLIRYLENNE